MQSHKFLSFIYQYWKERKMTGVTSKVKGASTRIHIPCSVRKALCVIEGTLYLSLNISLRIWNPKYQMRVPCEKTVNGFLYEINCILGSWWWRSPLPHSNTFNTTILEFSFRRNWVLSFNWVLLLLGHSMTAVRRKNYKNYLVKNKDIFKISSLFCIPGKNAYFQKYYSALKTESPVDKESKVIQVGQDMDLSVLCHLVLLQQLNKSKGQTFHCKWSAAIKSTPFPTSDSSSCLHLEVRPRVWLKKKCPDNKNDNLHFHFSPILSQQKIKKSPNKN